MSLSTVRNAIKQKILATAHSDPQIVGCLDYGSTSENRGDAWSDLDCVLFIRDAALPAFEENWKAWAAQFAPLLLAYISGVGHPWVIYDASPMPLRVDFVFYPASTLDRILQWPSSPSSVASMVLYDATDGQITAYVEQIVQQSLAPEDLASAFEQACGDFWYYLIRTQVKLLRDEHWAARHDFNFIIVGNLLALLRIECGAVNHWRGASAATKIEAVLTEDRLEQLNQCIPGSSMAELQRTLLQAAVLGRTVCEQIAHKHTWNWPSALANSVCAMLEQFAAQST